MTELNTEGINQNQSNNLFNNSNFIKSKYKYLLTSKLIILELTYKPKLNKQHQPIEEVGLIKLETNLLTIVKRKLRTT